jgi:hypothetical protein
VYYSKSSVIRYNNKKILVNPLRIDVMINILHSVKIQKTPKGVLHFTSKDERKEK